MLSGRGTYSIICINFEIRIFSKIKLIAKTTKKRKTDASKKKVSNNQTDFPYHIKQKTFENKNSKKVFMWLEKQKGFKHGQSSCKTWNQEVFC